mgnify:CR=1 FL=1
MTIQHRKNSSSAASTDSQLDFRNKKVLYTRTNANRFCLDQI